MMNHAPVLHALIVSASDDFAVANENGADGNAACGQTFFSFINRGLKKWVHKQRALYILPKSQAGERRIQDLEQEVRIRLIDAHGWRETNGLSPQAAAAQQ